MARLLKADNNKGVHIASILLLSVKAWYDILDNIQVTDVDNDNIADIDNLAGIYTNFKVK